MGKATREVAGSSSVCHANAKLAALRLLRGKKNVWNYSVEKGVDETETGSRKVELGWREKDNVAENIDILQSWPIIVRQKKIQSDQRTTLETHRDWRTTAPITCGG